MRRTNAPRGAAIATIVGTVLLLAVLATAAWALQRNLRDGAAETASDRFVVRRGDFDITIPASGELAALKQTEIASQLETRATITSIVEEGTRVSAGDVLLTLEDEEIRNRVQDSEVDVKSAETAWSAAQSNLQIKRDANRSELALADVDVYLAQLALAAWEQGTDISKRKQLALEVETTKKDYDRLVARFEASKDLLANDFISKDEYDRDEIDMIRARSNYEQAVVAQEVYEKFEREQEHEKLLADLKKATDHRTEIAARQATEITVLETEVDTREVSFNREKERLAKARQQLERCTIRAPQDGLVVYASSLESGSWGRGNDESPPTVGSELSRNRTVMVLPDTSQMVAAVKVNEALSGRIQPGQRAVCFSDAVREVALQGTVLDIGVLAESGGWRDPNRRDYTVRIKLDGTGDVDGDGMPDLKPSMRCRADIFVGRVTGATFVPVQAIFRRGKVAFVYVPQAGGGYAEVEVSMGRSSELFVEIIGGVDEGDVVMLREPSVDEITSKVKVNEDELAWPAPGDEPALGPGAGAIDVGGADGGAPAARGGAPPSGERGAGTPRESGDRPRRPERGAGRGSGSGAPAGGASGG
jgi:HlyD family secretion protein